MNIRSISNFLSPLKIQAKDKKTTDTSADRDNHNKEDGGQSPEKRKFLPNEIQELINYLKGLAGVKDNNLTVRLEENQGTNVIFITDFKGNTVRRIPESEFHRINPSSSTTKGHLLNKSL